MYCPKCGARTGVYNGEYVGDDYLRRRKCPKCGQKIITVERIELTEVQGDGKHGGKRVARPYWAPGRCKTCES